MGGDREGGGEGGVGGEVAVTDSVHSSNQFARLLGTSCHRFLGRQT